MFILNPLYLFQGVVLAPIFNDNCGILLGERLFE
jgi:hypothetical protein